MNSKYLKAYIRHDSIRTRSCKKSYKHLLEHEKKLIKKIEHREQLSKYLDYLWNQAEYDNNGKVIQSTMDWNAYHKTTKQFENVNKSIEYIENKFSCSEQKILKKFMTLNSNRLYGGSY